MAHKRRKADLTNVQTYNLFSAFTDDGVLKARTFSMDTLDSDEEEDIEELKARIQKTSQGQMTSSKGGALSRAKKRRNFGNSDDNDDDDEVVMLSSSAGAENPATARNQDSPSPPPPPPTQLDDVTVKRIRHENRRAAKVFKSLETEVSRYQVSKAISEIEGTLLSPVMASPTGLAGEADTPGQREAITVKVRTREGLRRYEKYPMDQPFEAIFEDLARLSSVERKRIRVTRKGEDVLQTDTPRQISLHVADILDYVVVDGQEAAISYSLLDEEDFVTIRIRTREKNSGMTKRIAKMEPISRMLEEFAASQEMPVNSFRFMFDGEVITPDSTPQDLDMSDENVIDATKCVSS